MKFTRLGAFSALVAVSAFVGCSSGSGGQPEGTSSVGFNLRTIEGLVITSVSYDLNTQAGGDVLSGTIPVPNDNSVINGTLDALSIGSYSLVLSATGSLNGQAASCVADPALFSLAANQVLALPAPINLRCSFTNVVADDSATVTFVAGVTVEQINVVRRVVEAFGVTPSSVIGSGAGAACTFPPVAISVANTNASISYSWASTPDGTFALNAASTSGTYTCASNGTKTLTVSAVLGGATASRSVTVTCSGCTGSGPLCGNGIVEAPEQCDETGARCQSCVIVPTCGDGIVDAPEQCDTSGASATCTATCQIPVGSGGGAGTAGTAGTAGEGGSTAGTAGEGGSTAGTAGAGGSTAGTAGAGGSTAGAGGSTGGTAGGGGTGGGTAACLTCINANADLAPLQSELCDPFTTCTAVQECVFTSGCFLPVPANCYCGPDIDNCANPTFVPTGECAAEIRAGAGDDNPSNVVILERFFDFGYPTGVGMSIIDETTRACRTECFTE